MNGREDNLWEYARQLDQRLRAIEARMKAAAKRAEQKQTPNTEVAHLRALAARVNERYGKARAAESRENHRRYWIREFAARALPAMLLEADDHANAVIWSADIAEDLWGFLEDRFERKGADVGEKPQAAE